jgi:hypothetical protein
LIARIPAVSKHLIKNEPPFGVTNTVFCAAGQERPADEGADVELLLVSDDDDVVADVVVIVEVGTELLVVEVEDEMVAEDVVLTGDALLVEEDDEELVEVEDGLLDEDNELLEDDDELLGEDDEVVGAGSVQVASIITVNEPGFKFIVLDRS